MNINNPRAVMLKSLENACGLTAYAMTLTLPSVNVATDKAYQKNFTNYYKVRRDREWLKAYYEYMEQHKNDKSISFEQILRYLYGLPHRVKKSSVHPDGIATSIEASFSSKMLATIDPNYPVWDSQVIRALGIRLEESLCDEAKIRAYVQAYAELTTEIRSFLSTAEGRKCIAEFDLTFPNYTHLSPFKKIDFFLWNIGK